MARVSLPLSLLVLALLACGPGVPTNGELHVDMKPGDIVGRAFLGSVDVKGVGLVKLSARNQGDRIAIYATAVDGATLGRANADPALAQTLVQVRTPDGLEDVTIFWDSSGG
ncbi:MAG: hypothetical protein JRG76_01870 [Deltaproteobacteria bacterium]|nr:hypothetical protein [Deltaproteobacteria bacterium]MBW2413232.1 hypothetical protein [Deltaproteobacteria bacterium]